jgi:hypothetical protein
VTITASHVKEQLHQDCSRVAYVMYCNKSSEAGKSLTASGTDYIFNLFLLLTLVLTALFIYFISLPKVTCGLSLKVICDQKTAQPMCGPIGAIPLGKGILCKIQQMGN